MKHSLKENYEANILDFGLLLDSQLMGLTIKAEAEGEPVLGKIAVGTVILDRVEHREWDGRTIHEVCLFPKQFSCYNLDSPLRPGLVEIANDFENVRARNKYLNECVSIAEQMMCLEIPREKDLAVARCCQYLNPKTAASTREKWLKSGMRSIKVIGNHEFFAEG